jgi:hydroxymethylbilane synthase
MSRSENAARDRSVVRIGTRGSPLALAQANWFKGVLEDRWSGIRGVLTTIVTSGDRLEGRLAWAGGKGLFVKEIEEALFDGLVDVAVHSMKDLPAVLPDGLVISAVLARTDPRDVCVGVPLHGDGIQAIPAGASVGTASLRRRAQLLAIRPDLHVVEIRGNVDTRLRKRAEGVCDAVLVAAAGLIRLGIGTGIGTPLDPDRFVPAVAQGALALETRASDDDLRAKLAALNDELAARTVAAERAFLQALGGDCLTPIAAHAWCGEGELSLIGLVATPDGRELLRDTVTGAADEPEAVGVSLASQLRSRGADRILARVRESRR